MLFFTLIRRTILILEMFHHLNLTQLLSASHEPLNFLNRSRHYWSVWSKFYVNHTCISIAEAHVALTSFVILQSPDLNVRCTISFGFVTVTNSIGNPIFLATNPAVIKMSGVNIVLFYKYTRANLRGGGEYHILIFYLLFLRTTWNISTGSSWHNNFDTFSRILSTLEVTIDVVYNLGTYSSPIDRINWTNIMFLHKVRIFKYLFDRNIQIIRSTFNWRKIKRLEILLKNEMVCKFLKFCGYNIE